VWFVSTSHAEHPGKAVAWGVAADPSGGARLPGLLVADTLAELRAMLPAGLTRRGRTSVMPPDVVEVWG
jgi:hypothetical protein